jgi:predicted nucleic acid-binding protein
MFTIDASVHVNALNPKEAGSKESRLFLERSHGRSVSVFSPTLLLVEVAAALARVFQSPARAVALAEALRILPGHALIPLDEPLAGEAARLGARYRLRGADAVYAAVALRNRAILVTRDRQQLERLSAVLTVRRPGEALNP